MVRQSAEHTIIVGPGDVGFRLVGAKHSHKHIHTDTLDWDGVWLLHQLLLMATGCIGHGHRYEMQRYPNDSVTTFYFLFYRAMENAHGHFYYLHFFRFLNSIFFFFLFLLFL